MASVISSDVAGRGAPVAISVAEGDNVLWVSLLRRVGVDYLVVSYEDRWNGTGKHYLKIRADSGGKRCGMAPGQALALIGNDRTANHLPATLVFRDTSGQHECRVRSIAAADQ